MVIFTTEIFLNGTGEGGRGEQHPVAYQLRIILGAHLRLTAYQATAYANEPH